jgi:hypothetical protein
MEMRNVSILDPPQTEFDPWNATSDIKSMLSVPKRSQVAELKSESSDRMSFLTTYS